MSEETPSLDPELAILLLEELRRNEAALAAGAPVEGARRAVHAIKGSAASAGQQGLAESLARIERRLAAGDASALGDARARVAEAIAAVAAGRAVPSPAWPEPPDDLAATPRDPATAARYVAEMIDRLERVDRALAASGDDMGAALAVFREMHAMKGAALAVSDEVTAWFCHGLEGVLRRGRSSEDGARGALAEIARWRGVLAETIAAPERALETLRLLARPSRLPSFPPAAGALPLPPRRPEHDTAEGGDARSQREGGETLRVPTATIDRLSERVRQIGQARAEVADAAALAQATAASARALRLSLTEALRLIGPPRPWGAPAAALRRIDQSARELGALAERLAREATALKGTADRVGVESAAATGDLAAMQTTRVGWLFDRVASAVGAQARREGREVRLAVSGEETAIDRRVAEGLVDPVLQLARNAVTHGIEPVAERTARGKPAVGLVQLAAQPRSGGLRLVVQDDGAGVDVAEVRARAIARGTISPEVASATDDQTLLSLLFVPGFTTRDSADLLAGRGVGLDLALEAVHRLGGTIRLASRPGMGLTATLDVPFESGLVQVLWLDAAGSTFGLPAQQVRRVVLGRDPEAARAVPLAACLGRRAPAEARPASPSPFAIEIDPLREGDPPALVGVDRVGAVEEVTLRGVSPLVAAAGPYAGAIVRGAELRLCLDAHQLSELVGA